MSVVVGNANQIRTGPGRILMAPYGVALPSTVNGVLDVALLEVGFTVEGSEVSATQTSDNVVVAERLRAIRREITGGTASFGFTFAQMSPEHLRIATNSASGAITSTATSVRFDFPKVAGSQRSSLVWESEDALERLVLARVYSTGAITIPRRKGIDYARIPVEFTVEENSSATILGGQDMSYFCDPSLLVVA